MIIVTNVIAKASFSCIIMSEKPMELRRDGIMIGGFNFALIIAYAKPRIYFGGVGEALIQPKKGIVESALNIHCFKVINNPSRTKWMACKRDILHRQRWRWRQRWRRWQQKLRL